MNNRTKNRLVLASIGVTISFMAFTSYGSFHPLTIGFWCSILGGYIWYLLMYHFFKKYSSPKNK